MVHQVRQVIGHVVITTPDRHTIEEITLTAQSFHDPVMFTSMILEKLIEGIANRVISVTGGLVVPCPRCAHEMTIEQGGDSARDKGEMMLICSNPDCPDE